MNIRDHSSKFSIFVYLANVDLGASTKVFLSRAGYDAYYFQDLNGMLDRIKEVNPHIVIYATSNLPGSLSNFIRNVLTLNDEIKFIAISSASQFDILAQYSDLGHVDIVHDVEANLESRLLWSVDRACEKLFLTYQNEHLVDLLEQKASNSASEIPNGRAVSGEETANFKASGGIGGLSLSLKLSEYLGAASKEEILQKFVGFLPGLPLVYFKYLPSVRSFVATHAANIDSQDIQGVGVQLTENELKDLSGQIAVGLLPPTFNNMLVEAFRFNPPRVWPLFVQNQLEGVFTYSGDVNHERVSAASEEFGLFRLAYSHFCLEKKVDSLEVSDAVTEALNRITYVKFLKEEFDRSRRLRHPLAVIKIALDDFYELDQVKGESIRDQVLKGVAGILMKTSRANDKTARTALNEFSLLLPHCTKKGAALRAERIRRIIESSQLLEDGTKLSVSLGVSEYPTLCATAEALDESASKALLHIMDKGGNKICLFKAPDQHRPEFEVTIE